MTPREINSNKNGLKGLEKQAESEIDILIGKKSVGMTRCGKMEKVKLKMVKLLQWFSNFSAEIAPKRILKSHISPAHTFKLPSNNDKLNNSK